MATKHKFGLTLSGGGVKGLAHAGALQALSDNNLRPTCISGTSAGAMVGALYAAGVDPEKILELVNSTSLFGLHNFNWRKPGFFDISFLTTILEKHLGESTFEDLPIELHTVATDLITAQSKVFSSGKLIPAILASSAFPMLFSPIHIEDGWYADGGITNNFPVNIVRQRCDKLLGIYVSPLHKVGEKSLDNTLKIVDRVYRISINYNSVQKFDTCDWVIYPEELQNYSTFDMKKASEIYEIGYKAALKIVDEIKSKVAQ